jgi:hypothetical protein
VNSPMWDEQFFIELAARSNEPSTQEPEAPTRLKSRIFSAMVRVQQESGPLLSLTQTKEAGHALCFFENLVQIAPVGEAVKCLNPCSVCHARFLAERVEKAPIFWAHCPYVDFQKE